MKAIVKKNLVSIEGTPKEIIIFFKEYCKKVPKNTISGVLKALNNKEIVSNHKKNNRLGVKW